MSKFIYECHINKDEIVEAIINHGWIVTNVWIDHEDLFAIHPNINDKEVKSDEWGTLPIVTEYGDSISIPCHYIDC